MKMKQVCFNCGFYVKMPEPIAIYTLLSHASFAAALRSRDRRDACRSKTRSQRFELKDFDRYGSSVTVANIQNTQAEVVRQNASRYSRGRSIPSRRPVSRSEGYLIRDRLFYFRVSLSDSVNEVPTCGSRSTLFWR